jgi:hypothetical protein
LAEYSLTRGAATNDRSVFVAGLSGDVGIAVGKVARQLHRACGASAFGLDEQDLVALNPPDGSPGGLVQDSLSLPRGAVPSP